MVDLRWWCGGGVVVVVVWWLCGGGVVVVGGVVVMVVVLWGETHHITSDASMAVTGSGVEAMLHLMKVRWTPRLLWMPLQSMQMKMP